MAYVFLMSALELSVFVVVVLLFSLWFCWYLWYIYREILVVLGTAVDALGMAQKDALIKMVYTVAWRNGSVVTSTCCSLMSNTSIR